MDSNREKYVLNLGKRASILFVMKAVVYIRHSIVKNNSLMVFIASSCFHFALWASLLR